MQPTSLKELARIHDCVVEKIVYDASDREERRSRIYMECPNDLGHPGWAGKRIVLVAIDVATMRHSVWGIVGLESIDAIHPGISSDLKTAVQRWEDIGARFPDIELTISFSSGSVLEIICRGLEVDIEEPSKNT